MIFPESSEIELNIVLTKGKRLESVSVSDDIVDFIIKLVRGLRDHEDIERPPGVRATLGLYERAQTNAVLKGHTSVTFDDVKDVIVSVLGHRIKLAGRVSHVKSPEDVIDDVLKQVENEINKKKTTKID